MQSKAKTVSEYIASLPPDRRKEIKAVRVMIKKYLPKGYQEGMQYGMIGYYVPLALYPKGYLNKKDQPLPFISLASQKNYLTLYLMCAYANGRKEFETAWKKTGKKLDMGGSCIRFHNAEDLALDVIGKTINAVPVKKWIQIYEKSREKKTR